MLASHELVEPPRAVDALELVLAALDEGPIPTKQQIANRRRLPRLRRKDDAVVDASGVLVRVNGIDLNVVIEGGGPDVLLHGLPRRHIDQAAPPHHGCAPDEARSA